ncbi:type I restriction enzyme endonuclease domain-containing protein [Nostoc commune]|uniref:type I restriction enzyme endonuclease domain-containing protein n=1 Tax=Nostoc commune TaxID=1178 RepID=UPI0020740307|nr:type I restriction enzyme endonuclease domain-containing protein [Nostoc commune]
MQSPATSVQTIRSNVTIYWAVKESIKANLRRLVKRLLLRPLSSLENSGAIAFLPQYAKRV